MNHLTGEVDTPGDGTSRDEELEAAAINEVVAEGDEFMEESDLPSENVPRSTSQGSKLQKLVVNLPVSTLIHPRSVFERTDDFTPPAPPVGEWEAIQSLLSADPSQEEEDFIQFELDNFSCYVDTVRYPFEMRALHGHATRMGEEHFYFDGILRVGNVQHYVQKVRFDQIPMGNYGKDHETGRYESTVGDQIWVLSKLNEKRSTFLGQTTTDINIYYQLKNPSIEYARFHSAFLWVADLAKHVVDFCDHKIDSGCNVSIHHFKQEFSKWIRKTHDKSPQFLKWYKQRTCDDFRQSVIANVGFIRKEVFGVLAGKARHIHLFREIATPFTIYQRVGVAISLKKDKNKTRIPHTIVTPYIYECFSRLHLGQLLKPVQPSVSTEEAIRLSWPQRALENLAFTRQADKSAFDDRKAMTDSIKPGDLISTPPDEKDSGTRWSTEKADKKWFGLVQRVCKTNRGERFFDIIWLYQPDDTPCCSMKYPWEKELFLGNHCTCYQGIRSKIGENQVIDVHSVEWFGSPNTQAEFFVRQTYLTEERRFVTLENEHLQCEHERREGAPEYAVGDTVLVLAPGSALLEPFELLELLGDTVRLRRLRRRQEYTSDCAPNELVYTEEETRSSIAKIASRCIVRLYSPEETIPAPYNRDGTGNAFFITHRLLKDGSLEPLGSNRPRLRQGFDPKKREKKLRALDLFCGCGNFGRGLEDGGAVQAKWANDIWETAIHTYMANTEPGSVNPFLGSIDDLLSHSLEGKFSESVPRPGEVDVISGGSPCPGFSLITTDKTTLDQVKNRSLVASFASCIDFWRPRWGILENVKTIVQSSKNRTEDFFSQLICALVGMGYQAQIILGDAWSHGDPQTRVRAFLYFAAPGVNLPRPPYPSHSNPRSMCSGGLGKMTNGEPYVRRTDVPTAFRYVTAAEGTADLPDIYDAKPDTCISFPDHRLSAPIGSGNQIRAKAGDGKNRRTQILNIPLRPYNVNFSQAFYVPKADGGEPDMFPHERDAFPLGQASRTARISRGWGRAHPHKPFGTITTTCHMTDARTGGSLMHWEQPRPLSIMEARRAQGVPDDEVLCGTPGAQWEMVGNGVARGISTALGLALREAWRGSLWEEADGASEVVVGAGTGGAEEGGKVEGGGDGLHVPWADEEGVKNGTVLPAGRDEDKREDDDEVVLLTRPPSIFNISRGSSRTPGLGHGPLCYYGAAAAPTPGRLSWTTPATSLTVGASSSDEHVTAATGNGAGKRSLSKSLAEETLSSSASSKRVRLWEGDEDKEWDLFLPVSPSGDDDDDGDGDDDELPLQTQSGATVVRFSSADWLEEPSY